MQYPIFIPTRGRWEKNPTAKNLKEWQVDFYLVVEPHEYDQYAQTWGEACCLKLDKSHQGIAYARNWIKSYALNTLNSEYHWQIDDNIRNFRIREGGKNVKVSPQESLGVVEQYANQHSNIAQLGLSHSCFAFSKRADIDFNKQIYSCMLIKSSVDAQFNPDIIEDTDFSLQCLYKGFCTVLFNRILIDKITTGHMKGGNTDVEHGQKSHLRTQNLVDKYPNHFKNYEDKRGRWRVRPSRIWSTFTIRPN
jgi:hypothetical protein